MKFKSKLIVAALTGCTFNSLPAAACDALPMIGEVCPVAFNFAPAGWAFTHGQLIAVSQNEALFSIVGTMYGGDGRTSFGLPDTRSRVVIGAGHGPGLADYRVGQKGGVETVTLTVNQMPTHAHEANTTVNATTNITVSAQINASATSANNSSPSVNVLAVAPGTNNMYVGYNQSVPVVSMHADSINYALPGPFNIGNTATTNIGTAGGSQAHENRMPTLGVNWVISLFGVYPSRS